MVWNSNLMCRKWEWQCTLRPINVSLLIEVTLLTSEPKLQMNMREQTTIRKWHFIMWWSMLTMQYIEVYQHHHHHQQEWKLIYLSKLYPTRQGNPSNNSTNFNNKFTCRSGSSGCFCSSRFHTNSASLLFSCRNVRDIWQTPVHCSTTGGWVVECHYQQFLRVTRC